MSKSDFAFAFAAELNLNTQHIQRTTSDAVTFLKTYRPKDMRNVVHAIRISHTNYAAYLFRRN